MREFSHKPVTFAWIMAWGGQTQANLKRKLDQLHEQIFQTDLRIPQFKQQGNLQHVPNFEAAKVKIQKDIVVTTTQLELKIAQGKKARRC